MPKITDLIQYRDELQAKLDAVNSVLKDLGSANSVSRTNKNKQGKRKVSAAVKAKMSAAAKKRWAVRKAAKQ